MKKITFKTSKNGETFFATSLKAAQNWAEKKGLTVFVQEGKHPDAEDLDVAYKVGRGVWQERDN